MKIFKKFGLEIAFFIFVAFALLYQSDFNDFDYSGYFITLLSLLVFLIFFNLVSTSISAFYKKSLIEFSNFDISYFSIWGKMLATLIFGLILNFIMVVMNILSLSLFYSTTKPTHLGIPFAFYPLDGDLLIIPFVVDTLFYALILHIYRLWRINSQKQIHPKV